MNPALLQKGSNSFRTDSEIKDHEGLILDYCPLDFYRDFLSKDFDPVIGSII